MAEVTVVGGGVGGMVCALLLARQGHDVRLYEQSPRLGGKLAEHRRDGFTFSLGPSLLTMPELFRELGLGRELIEPELLCRYRFADGSVLDARRDPHRMAAAVDLLAPGEGRAWRAFHRWAQGCLEAASRTVFAGPLIRPPHEARLPDLLAVAPAHTLDGLARRYFTDTRLRQYVGRYATYAGSSPYRAPAALGCVPALEHGQGVWYVPGGLARLADDLALLLKAANVQVLLSEPVAAVEADGSRVTGVRLAGGERVRADVVVANTDAAALYGRLLPDRRRLRRIARLGRSSSALLILAGVEGRTPGLPHHSVLFSSDYEREFGDIFDRGSPPLDPTVYLGCSAVDDPSQAPEGAENWTMLVNVPARDPGRWPIGVAAYRDLVLERLAERGHDLAGRLRFADVFTPADLRDRYGAWGGAIYGSAYRGRLSSFRRPGNRGPRKGLYLVGGSAQPGGGLPMVTLGARIVAGLVAQDLRGNGR
ncbi:phytoene desaturase family protein [Nonomuraea gerenzanensis]|uniref:4,4'-diaponeurosporene oxygenase n=1 Tax=Nonomuraea gerenzanensis TaxID=93944 RepID=A0A1M4EBI9_9ACTN|nr:phytoene desaturase family protein [Nonomuraea gerenzanensis]UBU18479.1 phytoene desaturase [Nonomuraea gerenzanensis]SBO96317.1 FAD dependent oxidoreductase [Nonomuraea gerenzanensis]